MNRLAKAIGIAICTGVVFYCCGAFIAGTFDSTEWNVMAKVMGCFLWMGIIGYPGWYWDE